MGNIPQFQRNVVPSQTIFQSLDSAASAGRGLAALAQTGVEYALEKGAKIKQADDYTAVNEAGIKLKAQLNDEMDKFQRENSSSPDGKYNAFDAVIQERLKATRDALPSEEAKTMFDRYGLNLRETYQGQMQQWENVTRAQNFAQRVENTAEANNRMALLSGDLNRRDEFIAQAQSNVLGGSLVTNPQKIEDMRKKQVSGVVKSLLLGAAEKDPAAARNALKQEDWNKYLDADDLVSMDNQFERMQAKQESDALQVQTRKQLGNFNALKGDIALGVDIEQRAHDMFKAGDINGGQFLTLVEKQKTFAKGEAEKMAGREKMNLVASGVMSLDPSNKKDLKALDDYYQTTVMPTLTDMQPDDQARAVSDFVGQFGAIPVTLKTDIQGSLMAGSPERQLQASTLVSNIITTNPRVAAQFDDKTLGYATRLNDLANSGVPLADAVKSAQNATFMAGTPEYAGRVAEYKKQSTGSNPAIQFDPGAFTEWFRNDPSEVPMEMRRQWDALAKHYFVSESLNAESAMNLANTKILETWSVTNMNRDGSPEWMQYAPEAYYGTNSDWVKKQLISDLRSVGVLSETKDSPLMKFLGSKGTRDKSIADEFMKSAYLVPVPNNLNAQGKPSYYVYREQDGIQNLIIATNPKTGKEEAIIFTPDPNQTPEGKRAQKKLEESKARAQQKALKAYDAYKTKKQTDMLEQQQGIDFPDRSGSMLNVESQNPDAQGFGA